MCNYHYQLMKTRTNALKFVILLGIVSLCADATYEGGRSIAGVYLGVLGASGAVVGFVAGAGESIGLALRLFIGYISDKTQKFWGITTLGYILNTGAIPLLALTGRWETAAVLLIVERTGRAVRSPPRDVLLSHAATQVGRGLGFGLHEALDQVGAVGGPLLVWAILSWQKGYQVAFATLLIPALVGLVILLITQKIYPNPREFESRTMEFTSEGLPRLFWIYLVAVALIACGYADFPLIAFHFQQIGLMENSTIPLLYAVAMATDAIAALLFGRWFDRNQVVAIAGAVIIAAFFAPLSFLGNSQLALLGMGLWGVGMGAQESILKAAVAAMVPMDRRGSAFGIFYLCYGLAWFVGSTLMGILYDYSLMGLVIFSFVTQLAAVPLLLWVSKRFHLTQ